MEMIKLRAAKPGDACALLQIYGPYVQHTAITFEYEVPSEEEFAGRIYNTLQRYPYLVAEIDGQPVGYAYAAAFHVRPAYDWSVETSIYVEQGRKGCGTGRLLYQELERVLSAQHIVNLNACIAWPPVPDEYLTGDSVAFHRRMGYEMVGEFHSCAYKFGRWYNMVWMEKAIGPHPGQQPPMKRFPEIRDQLGL